MKTVYVYFKPGWRMKMDGKSWKTAYDTKHYAKMVDTFDANVLVMNGDTGKKSLLRSWFDICMTKWFPKGWCQ